MTHRSRQRTSARFASRPASVRARSSDAPENWGKRMKSMRAAGEELTVERPILEAEVLGLRQLLAEVQANRDELRHEMDDLRRDRDHWQSLAEGSRPAPPGAARRAWFCGRASSAGADYTKGSAG
jgi:hypothetical protein